MAVDGQYTRAGDLTGLGHDGRHGSRREGQTSASDAAADAAAEASIVSEVSIASAAGDRDAHPPAAGRPTAASCASAVVRWCTHEEEGLPADRFLDREISWLQFNERVLQLAADENVPLLERCRYLAIFASNLDEFFMVRVAGLKRRIATGIAVRSASGLEPREVLEQISLVAHELLSMQARLYARAGAPGARDRGHHHRPLGRALRRRARPARRGVHRPALPRADAAGRRPRAPVPLHLRPLAQPRRRARQPAHRQGALRPGQGAAGAAAPPPGRARPRRVAARRHVRHPLRAARGRHLGPPGPPVPRDGGARALHLPGHPQRGPRGRGGRQREPPHRARA